MKKLFSAMIAIVSLSVYELKAQLYIPSGSPVDYGSGIRVGIGPGANTQSNMLHVKTNVLNDGIKIEQTNANGGGAMLSLWHTNASIGNGHNWSLISTSFPGNTQGPGKLLFYDYTAPSGNNLRMQIDASGNVGIGVFTTNTNPAARLHVKTQLADDGMRLEQSGTAGNLVFGMYNSTPGSRNWSFQATGSGSALGNGNFLLRNETNSSTPLFVRGSDGHIGLGTTDPWGGVLHIKSGGTLGSGLCVEHQAAGPYEFAMKVKADNNETKAFAVSLNGTETMVIWGTGVINTPKLYAEEIHVVPTALGNPWPDFVFEPNYNLIPLDSVEHFYTTNNHLPGVPSAAEVQQNGIDVYEMNAILLQKMEELTLYLVQQQKEIDALKAENAAGQCEENK